MASVNEKDLGDVAEEFGVPLPQVRLTGSALDLGLIEIVSAKLLQHHPVDQKLNREIQVVPEVTSAGSILHFPDLEVPA